MVCTELLPYRILVWFNVHSLYCILIYENHLDSGDITEPRSGMYLKENLVPRQGHKCRKLLPLVGTKIVCED